MTARPRPRRGSALPAGDHGTPERPRHDELVARETSVAGVAGRRVKHACRLDWYRDKCSIVDRQHAAGIRFRQDWHIAAASPQLIGRYGPRARGRHEFSELQIGARRRVAKIIATLGEERARILVDVCCFDSWAAGRLPLLRDGLTALADHYGLPRAAAP